MGGLLRLFAERDDYGLRWRARRGRFLQRYGRECASCHDPDPLEVHVHHLRNPPRWLRRLWPMWAVPDSWLVPLCEPCHRRVPTGRATWGWSHVALTRAVWSWDDWPRWQLRRALRDRWVWTALVAIVVALIYLEVSW